MAAAVGLPARRSLVALGPDELDATSSSGGLSVSSMVFPTRFFMSLRSDSSPVGTMFADASRAPFVNDLLFSRWNPYEGARAVFRYAVVNLRKKLCVTSESPRCSAGTTSFQRQWKSSLPWHLGAAECGRRTSLSILRPCHFAQSNCWIGRSSGRRSRPFGSLPCGRSGRLP